MIETLSGASPIGTDSVDLLDRLCDAPMPVFDAIGCLAEMERHALEWHGLLPELMPQDARASPAGEPLPPWAVAVLERYAEGSWASYAAMFLLIRTYLHNVAGLPPDCVYEIWTPAGIRLDGQFQFAEHASGALTEHRKRYPDAFIVQMNVGQALVDDVAEDHLLPTLIGPIRYLAARMSRRAGQRHHFVCDRTGRTIAVTRDGLVSSTAFDSMSEFARATVMAEPN